MRRRNPFRRGRNVRAGTAATPVVGLSSDRPPPAPSSPLPSRRGEETRTYFRCSRYFAVGHEWFAATREYGHLGPYPGRDEAELGLAWHLSVNQPVDDTATGARPNRATATSLEILISEFRTCQREAAQSSALSAYASARQRLDELEEAAKETAHRSLRVRAIRHFLTELEI